MALAKLKPFPPGSVRLLASEFQRRRERNRAYLLSLQPENLLAPYYQEAGLRPTIFERAGRAGWPIDAAGEPERRRFDEAHWGWESPTSPARGRFLGHWLSAAARLIAETDEAELKARADGLVAELAACQQANGGEWAGSIPEKYLYWLADGRAIGAPQAVVCATLRGLFDMYALAGSGLAMEIIERWTPWFLRWTRVLTGEPAEVALESETGGMLELWANLYGATGKYSYRKLMEWYGRHALFEHLRAGDDVLTNRPARPMIAEVLGAARAWEVTWQRRWRETVEAFWRLAVSERDFFCTGGQTAGEAWTPPHAFAARLGQSNQELCSVYLMMRLAEYLFRWSGDIAYADYWELNLLNGLLAQQHPATGMAAEFLPLGAGSRKRWTTPTGSFGCCQGALVQGHTLYAGSIFYTEGDNLVINQFIPAEATWLRKEPGTGYETGQETPILVRLTSDPQDAAPCRPMSVALEITVDCAEPTKFLLKLRLPWWVAGTPRIYCDGEEIPIAQSRRGFCGLRHVWHHNRLWVELPTALACRPTPDRPELVAFMEGPVALAGLVDAALELHGHPADALSLLTPDDERDRYGWRAGWRTHGQPREIRFVPLNEITDERYTVYFPVRT